MAQNYISSVYYTQQLCQRFMSFYHKRGIVWVRAWPETTYYKDADGKEHPLVTMKTNVKFHIPKEGQKVRCVA